MNKQSAIDSTALNDRLGTLMEGIRRQDGRALDELERLTKGVLFATVYKVLNNPDDTQEVCQEVLLKLWQRPDLYDQQRGQPLTWLRTLARNRAIDRFRSKQRRSSLTERFQMEVVTTAEHSTPELTKLVATHEAAAAVREAVIKLTPEQQRVMQLAYFDGLTQVEIAKKLGEPLGTVKARIRRGVRSLRESIDPEDYR